MSSFVYIYLHEIKLAQKEATVLTKRQTSTIHSKTYFFIAQSSCRFVWKIMHCECLGRIWRSIRIRNKFPHGMLIPTTNRFVNRPFTYKLNKRDKSEVIFHSYSKEYSTKNLSREFAAGKRLCPEFQSKAQ